MPSIFRVMAATYGAAKGKRIDVKRNCINLLEKNPFFCASNNEFGDPAIGCVKNLKILYECAGRQFEDCVPEQSMFIPRPLLHEGLPCDGKFEILSARYAIKRPDGTMYWTDYTQVAKKGILSPTGVYAFIPRWPAPPPCMAIISFIAEGRLRTWFNLGPCTSIRLVEPRPFMPFVPKLKKPDGSTRVVSFYMEGISADVLEAQKAVFGKMGVKIEQILTQLSHGQAINSLLESSTCDLVAIFDIDCVPISSDAVDELLGNAALGRLVGAAQQGEWNYSNLYYAAPCATAFPVELWRKAGSPPFASDCHGDVESLFTWKVQEMGLDVCLLWPTDVSRKRGELGVGHMIGTGTTYEDRLWHAFEVRKDASVFLDKCKNLLLPSPASEG